jgi:hypothetical protein
MDSAPTPKKNCVIFSLTSRFYRVKEGAKGETGSTSQQSDPSDLSRFRGYFFFKPT